MKNKLKFLLSSALLFTLVASGCQKTDPTNSSSSSSGTTSETSENENSSEEESYVIKVNAPAGIQYSLDKTSAKYGETVTLTITNLDSGFSIERVMLNDTTELVSDSGTTYQFVMPNRSAIITIYATVTGEVTLIGDIAAVLSLEDSGIYVARNIQVPSSMKTAKFSYQVKGENDVVTTLDSSLLNEYLCFANITYSLGSGYKFEIAGGYTYDFYYDPASYYPCYVIRTSVDYLPQTESGLYSLFEGSYRSESTVNYPDLVGISYSVTDKTDSSNPLKIKYDYKMYENNISLAEVEDVYEEKDYFVYKNYDVDNQTLTVVDTYLPAKGNNDRFRAEANNRGAYAGVWDVVDVADEYGLSKMQQVSKREAVLKSTHTAHYGNQLEFELMYAYRVGFSSWNDEQTGYEVKVDSFKDESDNIVVNVNSWIEYDCAASTYTSEIHQGEIYEMTIVFTPNGSVKSVDYLEKLYNKDNWDFANDKPIPNATYTEVKKINATYTYGDPYSGTPEFDTSPYFIETINSIRFYDSLTEQPDNDGKSYLHYADKVQINKNSQDETLPNLVEFTYSPATALDFWQYRPVSSSNEEVITKTPYDLYNVMTCVNVGKSTVTFANGTKNSGTSYDLEITVNATKKFRNVYIYSTWGGYPGDVETSSSANIVAGEISSFRIAVTPSNAPIIYDAVSENPELLKIVSTGEKLTLDASGAIGITTSTTVRVKITSDWFDPTVTTKYVMFSFTIIPASANPIGTTWKMVGYEDHVTLNFTDADYTGTTSLENAKVGSIIDDGYQDDGTSSGDLRVDFIYSYSGGKVTAKLTGIQFSNNSEGFPTDPTDYIIDFYYDAVNDQFGVFLCAWEYDSDYEDYFYDIIYGDIDDEGNISSYTAFARS
ncbi:MAG: hypothetical protein ACI31G_01000 [Bacilli bacterium]